jgi:GYF domain 2
MIMAIGWYYRSSSGELGPFAPAKLRQLAADGDIKHNTPVRRGEQGSWGYASQVVGLLPPQYNVANPAPASSNSEAPARTEVPFVPPSERKPTRRPIRKSHYLLLGAVTLGAIALTVYLISRPPSRVTPLPSLPSDPADNAKRVPNSEDSPRPEPAAIVTTEIASPIVAPEAIPAKPRTPIRVLKLKNPPFPDKETSNFPDSTPFIMNTCPYIELSDFSFGNYFHEHNSRFKQHLAWTNIGTESVLAFEIVILKYDAFDQPLVGTRWVVTGRDSGDWGHFGPKQRSEDGTTGYGIEEVFTAIAYVRMARLGDGTVWQVDDEQLLSVLREIAPKIHEFGSLRPEPKQPEQKK